jgi:hypothetical protein
MCMCTCTNAPARARAHTHTHARPHTLTHTHTGVGVNPIKVPGTKDADAQPGNVAPAEEAGKAPNTAGKKGSAPTTRPLYGNDWTGAVRSIGAGEHWLPPKGPKPGS